jgi:hypothetical protein
MPRRAARATLRFGGLKSPAQHIQALRADENVNYERRQFGIARFNCQSAINLRYFARMTTFAYPP